MDNLLIHKYPEIARQFHPTKNIKELTTLRSRSGAKVWWLCGNSNCQFNCVHEWCAIVSSRTFNKAGCPYCSGRRICAHNSIVYTHPDIATQWHPTKNGNKKPENYSYGSTIRVWWICPVTSCKYCSTHEWETAISCRCINNTGCPRCNMHKRCASGSIATEYPELAKLWHPIKNGNVCPGQVSYKSHCKVWWLCKTHNHTKLRPVHLAIRHKTPFFKCCR